MSQLKLRSFHSVKGGVGKSSLATMSALQLAHGYPRARVVLIDMDLTGTSLADVLPLCAPPASVDHLRLDCPEEGDPRGVQASRAAIRRRGDEVDPRQRHVPFLNDYLLFSPQDGCTDANPLSLLWSMSGAPNNFFVIPSSALPQDVHRIVPVIFDEHQSAFLEARLEQLVAHLLNASADDRSSDDLYVVLDVPPTLPGLSRSVLSCILRLTEPGHVVDLSADGGTSDIFESIGVRDGRAFLVVSEDYQDLRAAARWLRLTDDDRLRVIVNRSQHRDETALREFLRREFGGVATPGGDQARVDDWAAQFARAIWVSNKPTMQFFGSDDGPSQVEAFTWLEE